MTVAGHRRFRANTPADAGRPKRLAPPLVSIAVADTGIGVAPEERKRIFEEFYRGKKSPRLKRGRGWGWRSSRKSSRPTGAAIDLISPTEGGSIFEIMLPAQQKA